MFKPRFLPHGCLDDNSTGNQCILVKELGFGFFFQILFHLLISFPVYSHIKKIYKKRVSFSWFDCCFKKKSLFLHFLFFSGFCFQNGSRLSCCWFRVFLVLFRDLFEVHNFSLFCFPVRIPVHCPISIVYSKPKVNRKLQFRFNLFLFCISVLRCH